MSSVIFSNAATISPMTSQRLAISRSTCVFLPSLVIIETFDILFSFSGVFISLLFETLFRNLYSDIVKTGGANENSWDGGDFDHSVI